MVDRGIKLPYLPDGQAQDENIAGDVQAAPRDIKCHLVDTVSALGVGPEEGDGVTLEHEGEEDGYATGKDDGSDHRNASAEIAHDEDAPVEQKDPDLDDCHSERPEHHEDVKSLKWSVGECERGWRKYDLELSIFRSF